jgi:hypothetical protein
MELTALPRVRMRLVGTDGNAFAILGRFKQSARRQGWDSESINAVLEQAMSGDYSNLIYTISQYADDETVSSLANNSEDELDWGDDNDW